MYPYAIGAKIPPILPNALQNPFAEALHSVGYSSGVYVYNVPYITVAMILMSEEHRIMVTLELTNVNNQRPRAKPIVAPAMVPLRISLELSIR